MARTNDVVRELEEDNRIFNTKRTEVSHRMEVSQPEKIIPEPENRFAGKYLNLFKSKKQKAFLGQEEKRVKEIPVRQVLNLAKQEQKMVKAERRKSSAPAGESVPQNGSDESWDHSRYQINQPADRLRTGIYDEGSTSNQKHFDDATFRVEVDPMQSVFISDNKVILFRRIVIDNRIYRQGFVILAKKLLAHLAESYFENQPMARFTRLRLSIFYQGEDRTIIQSGAEAKNPKFSLNRTFPRPFSFLTAGLDCERIPRSDGRNTLTIMMCIMGTVILMGFYAIYQSARSIVATSERRSRFVSSVTHELKTPLTNIRMYIEMLEQGIATNPEREQDYFKILESESTRLSRLINNILEFSKLEKKKPATGSFRRNF